MSDAGTDIARDQERCELVELFNYRLIDFLEVPNNNTYFKLRHSAKEVDSVGKGYWSSKTNLLSKVNIGITKLSQGDVSLWDQLLTSIKEDKPLHQRYIKARQTYTTTQQ